MTSPPWSRVLLPRLAKPVAWSCAVAFALLLGGCPDDPPDGGDSGAPETDSGSSDDGALPPDPDAARPPPDCSPQLGGVDGIRDGAGVTLLIGSRDATGFHPWEDGATVPFIWGFQGGTMIMPVLRVEGSALEGDPLCVHSRILNEFTDSGAPVDVAEFLMDVELHVRDGAYETDPVFDQLSYDSPEGRAASLEATISIGAFEVTGAVNVLVGPEGELPVPGG